MPLPLTFVRSQIVSKVSFSLQEAHSRMTATDWEAKASFSSMRPMSSIFRPAFSSAFFDAPMGPMPMMDGCTPTMAEATWRR